MHVMCGSGGSSASRESERDGSRLLLRFQLRPPVQTKRLWIVDCDGARLRLSTAACGLLYYPLMKANVTE
jgi:hypothetical protein